MKHAGLELWLAAALLATPTVALGQEDGDGDGDRTVARVRPSFGGLTGYGELITTDVVGGSLSEEIELGLRAGLVIQHQDVEVTERFGGGTARTDVRAQLYVLQGAVGLMDLTEVSLSVPVIDYEAATNFNMDDDETGFGNPEVAAKLRIPLDLDLLSAAVYTRIQPPWGEYGLFEPKRIPLEEGEFAEWELGGAVGVHVGMITGTMDLAMRLAEEGVQTFRYRFGVAVQPVDVFELGVYYDGEEYEGSAGSEGTFGAMASLLYEPVFVQLGAEGIILDNGLADLTTSGGPGDEVSGWAITGNVGAAF